ncbi:MAG: hypothetical protein JWQ40_3576 [Segetibacter sp.]|nr:hypothetical protein [Segetibacter sp.]
MMKRITIKTMLVASIAMIAVSCNKENTVTNRSTVSADDIASVQAIALVASASGDSIYLVNVCDKRQYKDSIIFSGLPASVATYLSANYAGYTAGKAFAIKDSSGTITGYVATIQFNGNPVGLKFGASGNFVRVLEQREGRDLKGHGWHQGGRFDDRGGSKHDTLALPALPAVITSYFSANYSQDTILRAFKNRDSSVAVISSNNGLFATIFTSTGTFVSRSTLPTKRGKPNSIDVSALPSNAQAYLTTTYPNYVFKHAFKIMNNGTVQGYAVFIDANSTKYAIAFDATGAFVKAVSVR